MKIDFEHIQSAHCENGVTTNLLKFAGVPQMTEPLAFGIGSGLFFIYIPIIKINNGPAIAFRTMPGNIFKRNCTSLNIPLIRKKFRSRKEAEIFLDNCLINSQPVGCQVGVYYLSYFPKEYRFHFNAHNIVVYGKEGENYLISDPVMETVTTLTSYELERVRFSQGPLAPKGQIYYPKPSSPITNKHISDSIKTGIKRNVRDMLYIPGSIAGVAGIKYTANKIKNWKDKLGLQKAGVYLAQLVRMQEEIGTGGGGFRFIYAAFLQQAYKYIPEEKLLKVSQNFTKSGDLWRSSAVLAAGIYKGRLSSQADFDAMSDHLLEIHQIEKEGFRELSNIKWK